MYGGLCTPPYLGTPKHNAFFAYIYKAILHCNFAVNSGYNCKIAVLRAVENSGYNCIFVRFVNRKYTVCIFTLGIRVPYGRPFRRRSSTRHQP